jgi:DNA (cytosine-5)-methyltransferase 1
LTTKERTYIQTFPEDFQWIGSKTELEQIIGNAVPVNLGKFVATCIQEYITDPNREQKIKRYVGALEFEYA